MKASIIIPTYNRADVLLRCLTAVSQLRADPSSFETIIVDNASTDHTKETCMNFVKSHPNLAVRYVFESMQGLSYARNRGVIEAQGEIICMLDDDSPPAPEWLDALLKPFCDPRAGCAGGPSKLDFQGQLIPAWLQGDLQALLSAYGLPFTKTTEILRVDCYPHGCNLAIRRSLFAQLGFFRVDLGRSGNQLLSSEEIEIEDRIRKAGWKVIYVPEASVNHLVPPSRISKEYVYQIGRGLAKSHIILTADRNVLRILRWFASDTWYATRMLFWLIVALLKRKPLWFDDYMRFWMVANRIPIRLRWLLQSHTNPKGATNRFDELASDQKGDTVHA